MLPTKLARAALRGTRASTEPPVGVLMGELLGDRRQRILVPTDGEPATAYVPTGYVPNGEVIAVTLSNRRADAGKTPREVRRSDREKRIQRAVSQATTMSPSTCRWCGPRPGSSMSRPKMAPKVCRF